MKICNKALVLAALCVAGFALGAWRGEGGAREWPELWEVKGGVRFEEDRGVVLLGRRVIRTSGAVEKFRRTGRVADKIEVPKQHRATRRGTGVYLVQFEGLVGESERGWVEKAGGRCLGYVPHNTLLVEWGTGRVERLAMRDRVRWVGWYGGEDKVHGAVARFVAKGEGRRRVRIVTFRPEDVGEVSDAVRAAGGVVEEEAAGEARGYVRAVVDAQVVRALEELAEVEWIEPYVAPRLMNDVAVQGPRLNVWNVWTNYGLTGRGQIVAVCDTGLDTGNLATMHPDFTNRIRAMYALGRPGDWSDPDGHGTHVSGSVLGSGAASSGSFRGTAYEAELIVQSVLDSGGGLGGLPSDLNNLFRQVYTNGARIHSDSWGSSVAGSYGSDSRQCDQFMWNNKDMLLVFAAGNDGIDGNRDGVIDLDSMVSPGTAKNVLTVGASENQRTSGGYATTRYGTAWPSDYPAEPIKSDYISRPWDGSNQGMAAFSSRGPCDDGRVKPDVCAPGTDVISCRSRAPGADTGWGVYNTMYVYMGGTSMATPLSAGAAALVRQYLVERRGITNPSAALVKAVLLNGARSLSPGQYGTGAAREILGWPRPNNVEGWGQINVEASLFPPPGCTNIVIDAEGISTGATNTYYVAVPGTNKLCVTLVWTDYPGSLSAAITLVNDLDLIVRTPDGEIVFGNGKASPDRLNNVEGIDFPLAEEGVHEIKVVGQNVPYGPQPYALVIREDRGIPSPRLWYSPTNIVVYGDGTEILMISNKGTVPLSFQLSKPLRGYEVRDSDEPGGPVYSWIDISGIGTEVLLNDDSVQGPYSMPFAFPFFERYYTTFTIGANGGIGLADGDIPYENEPLPSSSVPNQFLAVFWDDLDPAVAGKVYYHMNTNRVVVSWVGVPRYRSTDTVTFQAILYRGGEIVYQYRSMNGTLNSCTIGIQASGTGPAVQKVYNQAYLKNNLALRFKPSSGYDWLQVIPTNGTVTAGSGLGVQITCNGSGLTVGEYEAVLSLTHNAPTVARDVRVVMIVPEGGPMFLIAIGWWWVWRVVRCRCE